VLVKAACHTKHRRIALHHAIGADVTNLEDQLTTWVPNEGRESPNALDALVWAIAELAGLHRNEKRGDGRAAIAGATAMTDALKTTRAHRPANVSTTVIGGSGSNVASMLGRRGSDRI
jgi:hypothetical protein